jgi:anti-sigma B factor antagonist
MSGLGTTVVEDRGGLTVVSLAGAMDVYNTWETEAAVARVDPAEEQVVVDLSRVTLIDSSGMRALVRLRNRAADGDRPIGVVCPRLELRRIMDAVGVSDGVVVAGDLGELRTALAARKRASIRSMAAV